MSKSTKAKSRYKGDRRKLTVVMSDALVLAGQEYFPKTKYGSLSGFIAAKTAEEFRKCAAKMRAAGIKIPEAAFVK
jgi:hypothetical protein